MMNLNPTQLPEIAALRRRSIALATLDAMISPEWEYRYYSFDPRWGPGLEMASMRNGQGDEWFLLFGSFGAALKGYDHESHIPGTEYGMTVRNTVPAPFAAFLDEPAFTMNLATFCYWREPQASAWSKVWLDEARYEQMPDGSADLLGLLIAPAAAYQAFAGSYFERDIPLAVIEDIYRHSPLTALLVEQLNPDLSLGEAHAIAEETGYPTGNILPG